MILISGATGTIGREVVRQLTDLDVPLRAMSRGGGGPHGVRADFDDPKSLRRAVDGVDALFLLTAPATATSRHDVAMLDAAREAGVAKVVKLSAIGTGSTTADGRVIGAWHLAGERAVRASGAAWTILRPSSFASNVLRFAAEGRLANLTGDGKQGVVDPRDVAAVAVAALTADGHAGRTYTLTGPELLSVPEQAAQLGQVLGRAVGTVEVPLEHLLGSGMDPAAAEEVTRGTAWVRAGHNAVVTDDVERVLGRPPRRFADWVRDNAGLFG
ncbi:NAD(P)H-binding protein [Umezawaea endophytica]|uniref:NAD(P)H-binding protein n=1 Tax=Umezawaea endophytica TaxID=1654476 RepID=A0A9X2VGF3_9PSEU|nr:NAD(P)H-binding protein [Umezawaea endophytica]MCS7476170.1 NAD(P)H-binding protein [Umezawaea endophytica]